MRQPQRHWTEEDTGSFLYSVASDFVLQIEEAMERSGLTQAEVAERLGVSEGRVSQVLNNPGNLTLKKVIEYARAVGTKVSLVAYDDADPDNKRGPINSEIFSGCWERAGKPSDFFSLGRTERADEPRAAAVVPIRTAKAGSKTRKVKASAVPSRRPKRRTGG